MIFTVSSIDFIPIFYWSLAGICSAYIKICKYENKEKNQTIANTQPDPTLAAFP